MSAPEYISAPFVYFQCITGAAMIRNLFIAVSGDNYYINNAAARFFITVLLWICLNSHFKRSFKTDSNFIFDKTWRMTLCMYLFLGWAHVVCALYIPEVQFANVSTMEPIVLQSVPHDRYNKVQWCHLIVVCIFGLETRR